MPVDINDYRKARKAMDDALGNTKDVSPPPSLESADISEYLTENEAVNATVRQIGVFLHQIQAVIDETKEQLAGANNDPAIRTLQIKFWLHTGIAHGARGVLTELKKQSSGLSLVTP